jgi:hypothetical protein
MQTSEITKIDGDLWWRTPKRWKLVARKRLISRRTDDGSSFANDDNEERRFFGDVVRNMWLKIRDRHWAHTSNAHRNTWRREKTIHRNQTSTGCHEVSTRRYTTDSDGGHNWHVSRKNKRPPQQVTSERENSTQHDVDDVALRIIKKNRLRHVHERRWRTTRIGKFTRAELHSARWKDDLASVDFSSALQSCLLPSGWSSVLQYCLTEDREGKGTGNSYDNL